MHTARSIASLSIILILTGAVLACDVGPALFTDDELDSMYEVTLSLSDGQDLQPGAVVASRSVLEIGFETVEDAPSAVSLDLVLMDADEVPVATIRYSEDPETKDVFVEDLTVSVPPFSVPDNLEDGYYLVRIRVYDAAGALLSEWTSSLLLFEGVIPPPAISVYPGTVFKQRTSLLKLETGEIDGIDPWVRWVVGGRVLAAGLISEHTDRVAWQVPDTSAVYAVRAEIYPFMPPAGFEVPPLATASLRLPASENIDDASERWLPGPWSLVRFDGSIKDDGSRRVTGSPVVTGSPYLDTWSSGYGYRMGAGAGLVVTTSVGADERQTGGLDEAGNQTRKPAAFTILASFAPVSAETADGLLYRIDRHLDGAPPGPLSTGAGGRNTALLEVGVRQGMLYATAGGATIRQDTILPAGLINLAVSVESSDESGGLYMFVDDELVAYTVTGATGFGNSAVRLLVAGPDGLEAVYDEVRIVPGVYPAYEIASRTGLGADYIVSAGFESGVLPEDVAVTGGYMAGGGALRLDAGASMALDMAFPEKAWVNLSFDVLEGRFDISLPARDGADLRVSSTGTVTENGKVLMEGLQTGESDRFSIGFGLDGDRFVFADSTGRRVITGSEYDPERRVRVMSAGDGAARLARLLAASVVAPELPATDSVAPGDADTAAGGLLPSLFSLLSRAGDRDDDPGTQTAGAPVAVAAAGGE